MDIKKGVQGSMIKLRIDPGTQPPVICGVSLKILPIPRFITKPLGPKYVETRRERSAPSFQESAREERSLAWARF
ncbi:hypothetical protein MLD38_040472 [Melastoma candidum]|nr:hypothetical protein MLD38_040472 [Melastoma candidum]